MYELDLLSESRIFEQAIIGHIVSQERARIPTCEYKVSGDICIFDDSLWCSEKESLSWRRHAVNLKRNCVDNNLRYANPNILHCRAT